MKRVWRERERASAVEMRNSGEGHAGDRESYADAEELRQLSNRSDLVVEKKDGK